MLFPLDGFMPIPLPPFFMPTLDGVRIIPVVLGKLNHLPFGIRRPAARLLLKSIATRCFFARARPNFRLVAVSTAGGFSFSSCPIRCSVAL